MGLPLRRFLGRLTDKDIEFLAATAPKIPCPAGCGRGVPESIPICVCGTPLYTLMGRP